MNTTVVIPVYNAFDEALACVESVLRHTSSDIAVLVVDDCSTVGKFRDFVPPEVLARTKIERNHHNLGFPGTCNRAFFELVPKSDIVLLNSDTVVTERWVEKLRQAAYSRSNVATVTPLTNNGTICSVPEFIVDNEIPRGFSLDSFAALVEQSSRKSYPILPTCVGHCLYLRREPLDVLRGFDAFSFGSGYGEENDFSCRAQSLGYVDILDDSTYIFHKGKCSFGSGSSEQQARNAAVLDEKFPTYLPRVHEFIRRNPLDEVHGRIWNALTFRWASARQGTVLHILHNGPLKPVHHALGGTEMHVADLISSHAHLAHWSLVPKTDRYLLTAHLPGVDRVIQLPRPGTPLADILRSAHFDSVHVHHALGFDREELVSAVRGHGRYMVSVHDFHLVCQHGMMLRPNGTPCSRHECVDTCKYSKQRTDLERGLARSLMEDADRTIVFSERSREILDDIFVDSPDMEVMPHGIDVPTRVSARMRDAAIELPRPAPGRALRLVCLGSVSTHKGLRTLERLCDVAEVDGISLEVHVLGEVVEGRLPAATVHGAYQRGEALTKLRMINPHIGLVLSLAPETYCLTMDELMSAGLPVIVTNAGAPADRVTRSGAGWVLSSSDSREMTAEIVTLLKGLLHDWNRYLFARGAASRVELRTLESELSRYGALYEAHALVAKDGIRKLIGHFQPNLVADGVA